MKESCPSRFPPRSLSSNRAIRRLTCFTDAMVRFRFIKSLQSIFLIASVLVSTPEPQTPGSYPAASTPEFAPIVVHIAYSLRSPVDGLEFVLPNDSYPFVSVYQLYFDSFLTNFQRVPHAYTTPSSPDSARCWVPCLDNLWEKSTWEFEFVVPRYLEERVVLQDEDDTCDAIPTIVVCSGDLIEQVLRLIKS